MTKIAEAIAREIGADRLVTDVGEVAAHRTDYWILAHLRARQGRLAVPPVAVVCMALPDESCGWPDASSMR